MKAELRLSGHGIAASKRHNNVLETKMLGTSIVEFFDRFPDEKACLQHLVDQRWREHSGCPRCGHHGGWSPVNGTKKYKHACGANISPTEGTVMYRSNLSLMAWFYALLLLCNSSSGIRSAFIRKQLGIGVKSAHRLCNQLRTHLAAQRRPERMGGLGKTVYVDEAHIRYVGTIPPPTRPNAVVMGIACDGQVITGIIRNRKRETMVHSIKRFVAPDSTIVTDGHASYRCLPKLGWDHIVVNHNRAFHDFNGVTTNPIECYWPHLKRALRLYRQAGEHNLWRFLAESEFRFNRRHSKISPFAEAICNFPEISPTTLPEIRRRFVWP